MPKRRSLIKFEVPVAEGGPLTGCGVKGRACHAVIRRTKAGGAVERTIGLSTCVRAGKFSGMNHPRWILFALLALPATAIPGRAVVIVNPGFENVAGMTVYNEFTFGSPPGWSLYDPFNITAHPQTYEGTLMPNGTEFFPVPAPQGSRVAILFNQEMKGAGEYGFTQILGEFLAPDTQYTLTVQVGNITSGTAVDNTFYDLSNFPGYRVDFLAGGVAVASDNNTLSIAEGAWGLSTVVFTTGPSVTPSLPIGIRLVSLNSTNAPGIDNEVDFDDVQLTAVAIPEPGTWILLLLGLIFSWFSRAGLPRRSPQDEGGA